MGWSELIKQWADEQEEKAYGDDPAKLAEVRAKWDRRRTALAAEEPDDIPDLQTMSDDEIELLRLKTEDEIEAIQTQNANSKSLIAGLLQKVPKPSPTGEALVGLAGSIRDRVNDHVIRQKKLLLHKIAIKQRPLSPPQLSPEEKVSQEAREKIASIRRLEAACEEDVAKDPDHADIIIRHYRKAIDAIRERQ